MRLFGRQPERRLQKQDKRRMSLEPELEEPSVFVPKSIHHKSAHKQQKLEGVNSQVSNYAIMPKGTTGQHLWTLNLSALPGEQKRLLSINGGSTFVVNYAQQTYPGRIDLILNQIDGALNELSQSSHSIATLVPTGPAIPVYNAGGVIGYNVSYEMLGEAKSWDISGIPVLTFDLNLGEAQTPAQYPLSQPLVLSLHITHVTF